MEEVQINDVLGTLEITPEVFDVGASALCDFDPKESKVTEYLLLILYQMKLAADKSRQEVA